MKLNQKWFIRTNIYQIEYKVSFSLTNLILDVNLIGSQGLSNNFYFTLLFSSIFFFLDSAQLLEITKILMSYLLILSVVNRTLVQIS